MTNRIDHQRPDAPALAAPGPHAVGVQTRTVTNPDQPDVLAGGRRDRHLTFEYWYPAITGTGDNAPYRTLLRDGRTEISLHGSAARQAQAALGDFPLVILSHGFPGNRMLMSHLGENLASKGYRVAALDHPESTYGDAAYLAGEALGSTLVNRPLDTACIARALGGPAAIIGYSMGGYGALISGGAQLARSALTLERLGERAGQFAPHWSQHCEARAPDWLKCIVTFGPWGRQMGLWNADGMARLSVPHLLIAGSLDDISGYETGMRLIHEEARVPRHMVTFQGAGHNAGAPIPAPAEAWSSPAFDHYADKVWDTVRMNNIAQHCITAFLGRHLKGLEHRIEALPGISLESLP